MQDTFIIATAKLQGLRDPDQLRPWLHAVARNECLRQPGSAESQRNGSDNARLAGQPDPDGATPTVTLPPTLREQVLKACADDTPTERAYRVSVTHRAGSFGHTGFPKPVVPAGPVWWQQVRRRRRAAAAVAAVAGAVLAAGIATLLIAEGSHPAKASTVALVAFPVTLAVALTGPGAADGRADHAGAVGRQGKAASGTFTLTAVGGPVSNYAIGMLSSMVGKVSVSPSAGTLAQAGDKVMVTVTVKSLAALDTRVTVEPSGQVITVVFSIKA